MPPKKALTKSELLGALADKTDLTKKQVDGLFDALLAHIRSEFRAGRDVSLPIGLKIRKKHVPAKPARPGRNPATGESIMLRPKPASTTVKVTALKKLKDTA